MHMQQCCPRFYLQTYPIMHMRQCCPQFYLQTYLIMHMRQCCPQFYLQTPIMHMPQCCPRFYLQSYPIMHMQQCCPRFYLQTYPIMHMRQCCSQILPTDLPNYAYATMLFPNFTYRLTQLCICDNVVSNFTYKHPIMHMSPCCPQFTYRLTQLRICDNVVPDFVYGLTQLSKCRRLQFLLWSTRTKLIKEGYFRKLRLIETESKLHLLKELLFLFYIYITSRTDIFRVANYTVTLLNCTSISCDQTNSKNNDFDGQRTIISIFYSELLHQAINHHP